MEPSLEQATYLEAASHLIAAAARLAVVPGTQQEEIADLVNQAYALGTKALAVKV